MGTLTVGVDKRLEQIENDLRSQPDQHLEFMAHRDMIGEIVELAQQKDILLLGHNYMKPLVHALSEPEARGDSLALSIHAKKSKHKGILFNGVRFMGETAAIVVPEKSVFITDITAGCSLADNFTAEDVREYKRRYPKQPVVTYVNSYAEAKAESDYCCTSGNALQVAIHAAKEYHTDKVVFLPDSLMGRNVQEELNKLGHTIDLIYPGKYDEKYVRCEVHEQITGKFIKNIRQQYRLEKGNPKHAVIVHRECPPDAVAEADHADSTFGMLKYMSDRPDLDKVYLGTECEMTANAQREFPGIEFIRTCQINCKHMAKVSLEKILHSLRNDTERIAIPEDIRKRAYIPIQRMLDIPRN